MDTPAVIKLDDRMDKLVYPLVCQSCKGKLMKGELVFYSRSAGYKHWHSKDLPDGTRCYDPKWKANGTPYAIRKQMAITYQTSKLPLNSKIKLALRRFRRELMIKADQMKLDPLVFQYLTKHHLIELDEYKGAYGIIPKGFSWDVDTNCVKLPGLDEDIMERDADVEPTDEE